MIPPKTTSVTVHESELVSEVHAEFGVDEQSMIKQITRLLKGKDFVEVEYTITPVPINDGIGKEIVSRFSTNIDSGDTFFTDSNGREFMERIRGNNKLYGTFTQDPVAIEPIGGNYYPANSATYIEDGSRSFGVLLDRSQGVSSLKSGSIELMIQRRLLHDDARGAGECLNETDAGITPNPPYGNAERLGEGIVIKGIHRLMIGVGNSAAALVRSRMDETFSPPHVFAASAPADNEIQFQQPSFSALTTSLPDNVMLITYTPLRDDGAYLVRLAHQYGPNESSDRSVPVEVDLSDVFPSNTITSVTEKTLSGNQNRVDWEAARLYWGIELNTKAYSRDLQENASVIVLKPLEIRTFEVRVV